MTQICMRIKDTNSMIPEPNLSYLEKESNQNSKIFNKNFHDLIRNRFLKYIIK